MKFERLQHNWHELGIKDPLWAVATAEQYRGGRWDPEQFFGTGRDQVQVILAAASRLHFATNGCALDFGCGVGRLTQALTGAFDRVIGVDIAPSMIELARQYDIDARCEFIVNDRPDLSLFPDCHFDFVCSEITLMHMRPEYSFTYLREFVRVCKPGGLVVFQLPEETPKQRLRARIPQGAWEIVTALRTLRQPRMEIYGIDRADVERAVTQARGRIVLAEPIQRTPSIQADNFRYFVTPVAGSHGE